MRNNQHRPRYWLHFSCDLYGVICFQCYHHFHWRYYYYYYYFTKRRAHQKRSLLEAFVGEVVCWRLRWRSHTPKTSVVGGICWRKLIPETSGVGGGRRGRRHRSPQRRPRPLAGHPRQEGNKRTSAVMKNSREPSGKTLDPGFLLLLYGMRWRLCSRAAAGHGRGAG